MGFVSGLKWVQKWVKSAKKWVKMRTFCTHFKRSKCVKTHFSPTLNPFRDFRETPLFTQFKGCGNCFLRRAPRQSRPSIILGEFISIFSFFFFGLGPGQGRRRRSRWGVGFSLKTEGGGLVSEEGVGGVVACSTTLLSNTSVLTHLLSFRGNSAFKGSQTPRLVKHTSWF